MPSSYVTIDGIQYPGDALATAQVYLAARSIIDAGKTDQLIIEGSAPNGNASRTVILITPHTSVHQSIVQDPLDQFSAQIMNELTGNVREITEKYAPRDEDTDES